MTLRLRRHFTTQIASCAFALAFFGTLALICLVGARISTASGSERYSTNWFIDRAPLATARSTDSAHSQEQEGEKRQVDRRWKIQIPAQIEEQKGKGEQKKQDEPLLRIETELVQID